MANRTNNRCVRKRPGALTRHHPAKKYTGDNERTAILQWRSMELRVAGKTLREIADILEKEYELKVAPAISTISEWLDRAFADAMEAKQTDADRHCTIAVMRLEKLVSEFLPIALGDVRVQRIRRVDGEDRQVIDEDAFNEKLRAAEFIRRAIETNAKLLRIGRPDLAAIAETNSGGESTLVFVEKLIQANIVHPGKETKEPALSLSSGDKLIDDLDTPSAKLDQVKPVIDI